MLLLIVPDSAHVQSTPITLGTLHIDMAIKMATKRELENLNKQWQRSSVAYETEYEGNAGGRCGRGTDSDPVG